MATRKQKLKHKNRKLSAKSDRNASVNKKSGVTAGTSNKFEANPDPEPFAGAGADLQAAGIAETGNNNVRTSVDKAAVETDNATGGASADVNAGLPAAPVVGGAAESLSPDGAANDDVSAAADSLCPAGNGAVVTGGMLGDVAVEPDGDNDATSAAVAAGKTDDAAGGESATNKDAPIIGAEPAVQEEGIDDGVAVRPGGTPNAGNVEINAAADTALFADGDAGASASHKDFDAEGTVQVNEQHAAPPSDTTAEESAAVHEAGHVVAVTAPEVAPEGSTLVSKEATAAIVTPASQYDVNPDNGAVVGCTGEDFPGETADHATAVRAFADKISAAWHKAIDAILTTARFCADADSELSLKQKNELIAQLPFGLATFSKLVGIGNDMRLQKPDIKQLLPPHYTTLYLITTFKEDELTAALADRAIHAEVKRGELEKWRDKHRKEPQGGQILDAGALNTPVVPKDVANPSVNEAAGEVEGKSSDASATDLQTLPDAPSSEAVQSVGEAVASPETAPPEEHDEISLDAEAHRLSDDEQQQLDAIVALFKAAPRIVQERFKQMLPELGISPTATAS